MKNNENPWISQLLIPTIVLGMIALAMAPDEDTATRAIFATLGVGAVILAGALLAAPVRDGLRRLNHAVDERRQLLAEGALRLDTAERHFNGLRASAMRRGFVYEGEGCYAGMIENARWNVGRNPWAIFFLDIWERYALREEGTNAADILADVDGIEKSVAGFAAWLAARHHLGPNPPDFPEVHDARAMVRFAYWGCHFSRRRQAFYAELAPSLFGAAYARLSVAQVRESLGVIAAAVYEHVLKNRRDPAALFV